MITDSLQTVKVEIQPLGWRQNDDSCSIFSEKINYKPKTYFPLNTETVKKKKKKDWKENMKLEFQYQSN